VGAISGIEKWRLYRDSFVVVVPSFSEVIGMVNLESAACGTPTITTFDTGLVDWTEGGGVLTRPDAEELAQHLKRFLTLGPTEYARRSVAMRRLIEDKYSWTVVGKRWLGLYRSLIAENAAYG
jgi:glycosyltransferase involved in cell wall biosynthesis